MIGGEWKRAGGDRQSPTRLGNRKSAEFKAAVLIQADTASRVVSVISNCTARLMSEGRAAGKPRSDMDMIVAAVAETNECVIVTDNEKHFSGLDVLNPLRKSP